MCDMAPKPIIAVAAFGNQTVNVRIPFEISAKSMENMIYPGVKFMDLLILKNICETTLATE